MPEKDIAAVALKTPIQPPNLKSVESEENTAIAWYLRAPALYRSNRVTSLARKANISLFEVSAVPRNAGNEAAAAPRLGNLENTTFAADAILGLLKRALP